MLQRSRRQSALAALLAITMLTVIASSDAFAMRGLGGRGGAGGMDPGGHSPAHMPRGDHGSPWSSIFRPRSDNWPPSILPSRIFSEQAGFQRAKHMVCYYDTKDYKWPDGSPKIVKIWQYE